jgi:hypothetical protein
LFNVYAQHLDNNGNELFVSQGQAVTTAPANIQMNPAMTYFPSTQETVIFFDVEDMGQGSWGLSGQKLNAGGQLQWGNAMLTLVPVSAVNDIEFIKARRAVNQVLVTYEYYNFGNFSDARTIGTLLDLQGNFVWTPNTTTICNVQSSKGHPAIGYFNSDQWILAWEDNRNSNPDIYAQNILLNGDLGPAVIGINEHQPMTVSNLSVYPNPLNDNAVIRFTCNSNENIQLTVHNILGETVSCLFTGDVSKGSHSMNWERTAGNGFSLPAGIYLVELISSAGKQAVKVILQ